MKQFLMRLVAPAIRRVTGEPSCQEINGFLADYMDGALDEETARRYEKHLEHCTCCGEYLDQYRQTIALTRECREAPVPEGLIEHTISFLREHRQG